MTTPWLKMNRTNRQTIVHTTQHRKLKNKLNEPYQKLGVISGTYVSQNKNRIQTRDI